MYYNAIQRVWRRESGREIVLQGSPLFFASILTRTFGIFEFRPVFAYWDLIRLRKKKIGKIDAQKIEEKHFGEFTPWVCDSPCVTNRCGRARQIYQLSAGKLRPLGRLDGLNVEWKKVKILKKRKRKKGASSFGIVVGAE